MDGWGPPWLKFDSYRDYDRRRAGAVHGIQALLPQRHEEGRRADVPPRECSRSIRGRSTSSISRLLSLALAMATLSGYATRPTATAVKPATSNPQFLATSNQQPVTSRDRLPYTEMSSERADFRSDIEGLRGLAILLVVLFHAGVSLARRRLRGRRRLFRPLRLFHHRTAWLAKSPPPATSTSREFYARRARRLLPAFLVVLLATVALALWIYAPIDQPTVASDARAVALQYGNVLFADNAVNYHAAVGESISSHVVVGGGEQFYVLWPLLFALIGRIYGASGRHPAPVDRVGHRGWCAVVRRVALGHQDRPAMGILRNADADLGIRARRSDRRWRSRIDKRGRKRRHLLPTGGTAWPLPSRRCRITKPRLTPEWPRSLPRSGRSRLLIGGHRAPEQRREQGARIAAASVVRSHVVLVVSVALADRRHGAVINWEIGVVGRLVWSGVALVLAVLTHRFVEKPWREGAGIKQSPQVVTAVAFGASIVAALLAHGAMVMAERTQRRRRFSVRSRPRATTAWRTTAGAHCSRTRRRPASSATRHRGPPSCSWATRTPSTGCRPSIASVASATGRLSRW